MKRLLYILMLCMLCVSITACQPTPDKPFVESKNDGELEEAVYGDAAPEYVNGYAAPMTWQCTIEGEDGIVFVNVDAKISVPDVTKYPVYRVSAKNITNEDAAAFIQAMIGDSELYAIKNVRSKAIIQADIEAIYETYEDPNSAINQALASGEITKEEYEFERERDYKKVDELREEYKSAPNDIELTKLERVFETLELTDDMGNVFTHMNIIKGMTLNDDRTSGFITIQTEAGEPFERNQAKSFKSRFDPKDYNPNAFINTSYARGNRAWIDKSENLIGMKLTYDEALNIANKLVYNKLCYNDYRLERVCASKTYNYRNDTDAEKYHFIYTPTFDGIPLLYYSPDNFENNAAYLDNPDLHCLVVTVENEDTYEVFEQSSLAVTEKINDNVTLLPFEEIQDIFSRYIAIKADSSDLYGGTDENGTNVLSKVTYNITDIRLGYVRIVEKNNINYGLLVPVWNFYGQQVNTYKEGSDPTLALNENGEHVFDQDVGNAFLCINAIDGSIIDLDIGY